MSKRHLQAVPATAQQSQRDADVPRRPREIDEFPRRMNAAEMAEFYRVSLKTFYRQSSEGVYDFARIRPDGGQRPAWDRERIKRHTDGALRKRA